MRPQNGFKSYLISSVVRNQQYNAEQYFNCTTCNNNQIIIYNPLSFFYHTLHDFIVFIITTNLSNCTFMLTS